MNETSPSSTYGWPFWSAVAVGCTTIGWGVRSFLESVPGAPERREFLVWLVGSDIAHDLIVAPIVFAVGWCIGRAAPAAVRPAVQVATIVSAAVVTVGWLPLRGSARYVGNPTIQPLDYSTAVLTALALVWAAVGIWALGRARRGRRSSSA